MNKTEIAAYLVSLNALIDAQQRTGTNLPSTFLVDEYNKYWGLLKEAITKENEDETRNRQQPIRRSETGAGKPGGEPRSGLPDR